MAKINNTSLFPIQTDPADDDLVLGTDVSNTSNDPGGETVNIRVDAISGGPKLLQTEVASGETEIDFTAFNNSKYATYLFTLEDVVVVSGINFRTSSDGGVTFDSASGTYSLSATSLNTNSAAVEYVVNNSQTQINLNGNNPNTGTFFGSLWLFGAASASRWTTIQATLIGTSGIYSPSKTETVGARKSDGLVDAVRFYPSSSTISGTIRMYGIRS